MSNIQETLELAQMSIGDIAEALDNLVAAVDRQTAAQQQMGFELASALISIANRIEDTGRHL